MSFNWRCREVWETVNLNLCRKLGKGLGYGDERQEDNLAVYSEQLRISYGSAANIIEHCGLKKVSRRWVPCMLTPMQKQQRLDCCRDMLCQFQEDKHDFLGRLVPQDETWVHHFDTESKQQSMQWKHAGSPTPKKIQSLSVSRKGDGDCFLGLSRSSDAGLS